MYTSICELCLNTDKVISMDCIAVIMKSGKLEYFINFEKFAVVCAPPESMISKLLHMCRKFTQLTNQQKICKWRNHDVIKKLDEMSMIYLWNELLKKAIFSCVDSTNTLHLKNNTVFMKLKGFYMLCENLLSDKEYTRLIISLNNVILDFQQRHFNKTLNSQLFTMKCNVDKLNNLMQTMYLDNCALNTELKLYKDIILINNSQFGGMRPVPMPKGRQVKEGGGGEQH